MATLNCSIVGQRYNTNAYSTTAASYAGFNYSNQYYTYSLQFTTPEFAGKSTGLSFNLTIDRPNVNNSKANAFTLRWALMTSDDQLTKYRNTKNEVDDDTDRLAVGIVEFTGMTADGKTYTHNVPTTALQPNTTYYLYYWGDGSTGKQQNFATLANTSKHSVVLEYASSFSLLVEHKTRDEDGTITTFGSNEYTVSLDEYFIPTTITPPEGYGVEDATFNAWDTNWTLLASGLANVDGFNVNCDMFISVYYGAGGSYVYFNNNGVAVKCEVYFNDNGTARKCEVYFNNNGVAVKV